MVRRNWLLTLIAALIVVMCGLATPARAEDTWDNTDYHFILVGSQQTADGDLLGQPDTSDPKQDGGVYAWAFVNTSGTSHTHCRYRLQREFTTIGDPDNLSVGAWAKGLGTGAINASWNMAATATITGHTYATPSSNLEAGPHEQGWDIDKTRAFDFTNVASPWTFGSASAYINVWGVFIDDTDTFSVLLDSTMDVSTSEADAGVSGTTSGKIWCDLD